MKYHALLVIFVSGKLLNCRLLQILGGALRVKADIVPKCVILKKRLLKGTQQGYRLFMPLLSFDISGVLVF